ncbi:hypothetical protein ACJMK2_028633 [Sinanodonta woodiana]|uniref:Band 7 domain-containing protein n=1 Tax=Sinanodonta woodiana TaxID=1069815 RepID=A0ABD3X9G3_SINWO
MSSVRYTRLPTEEFESVAFDLESGFQYNDSKNLDKKYKSIFTYGGPRSMIHQANEIGVEIVKQPLSSRICHYVVTGLCSVFCILLFPFTIWRSYKVVAEYERLIIFRLGRLLSPKGPGVVFIIPCIDKWKRVDTRVKAFHVPPLQVITSDGGIVELGATVHYLMTDVVRSVTAVQDINVSVRCLVRTVLNNHIVKYGLEDIETHKGNIVSHIMNDCNRTAESWGIKLDRLELSQLKILQRPNPNSMFGGGSGITQVLQQVFQAFTSPSGINVPQPASVKTISEDPQPSGVGAVGSMDIAIQPLSDPRELLIAINSVLSESLVRSVGAVYQFEVSGQNGGTFFLDLKNGTGSSGEGPDPHGNPDTTLELSVEDMQEMVFGRLKPMQAYMCGRLRVSGDLSAAFRMEEVLKKLVAKSKLG